MLPLVVENKFLWKMYQLNVTTYNYLQKLLKTFTWLDFIMSSDWSERKQLLTIIGITKGTCLNYNLQRPITIGREYCKLLRCGQ